MTNSFFNAKNISWFELHVRILRGFRGITLGNRDSISYFPDFSQTKQFIPKENNQQINP